MKITASTKLTVTVVATWLLALAMLVAVATQASAVQQAPREWVGEQTFRLYVDGGAAWDEMMITINVKDDPWLGNFAEALVRRTHNFSQGDYHQHDFRVDWIQLWDEDTNEVVRESGATGWLTGDDDSLSTAWWDTCGGSRPSNFRAVVRVQGRQSNGADWHLSDWKKVDSLVRFVGC